MMGGDCTTRLFYGLFFFLFSGAVQAMEIIPQDSGQKQKTEVALQGFIPQQVQPEVITTDPRVPIANLYPQCAEQIQAAGNLYVVHKKREPALDILRLIAEESGQKSTPLPVQHLLGKILYETENDKAEGGKFLLNAAKKGWPESLEYIASVLKSQAQATDSTRGLGLMEDAAKPYQLNSGIVYYHMPAVNALVNYYCNNPMVLFNDSMFNHAHYYAELMMKIANDDESILRLANLLQGRSLYLRDTSTNTWNKAASLFYQLTVRKENENERVRRMCEMEILKLLSLRRSSDGTLYWERAISIPKMQAMSVESKYSKSQDDRSVEHTVTKKVDIVYPVLFVPSKRPETIDMVFQAVENKKPLPTVQSALPSKPDNPQTMNVPQSLKLPLSKEQTLESLLSLSIVDQQKFFENGSGEWLVEYVIGKKDPETCMNLFKVLGSCNGTEKWQKQCLDFAANNGNRDAQELKIKMMVDNREYEEALDALLKMGGSESSLLGSIADKLKSVSGCPPVQLRIAQLMLNGKNKFFVQKRKGIPLKRLQNLLSDGSCDAGVALAKWYLENNDHEKFFVVCEQLFPYAIQQNNEAAKDLVADSLQKISPNNVKASCLFFKLCHGQRPTQTEQSLLKIFVNQLGKNSRKQVREFVSSLKGLGIDEDFEWDTSNSNDMKQLKGLYYFFLNVAKKDFSDTTMLQKTRELFSQIEPSPEMAHYLSQIQHSLADSTREGGLFEVFAQSGGTYRLYICANKILAEKNIDEQSLKKTVDDLFSLVCKGDAEELLVFGHFWASSSFCMEKFPNLTRELGALLKDRCITYDSLEALQILWDLNLDKGVYEELEKKYAQSLQKQSPDMLCFFGAAASMCGQYDVGKKYLESAIKGGSKLASYYLASSYYCEKEEYASACKHMGQFLIEADDLLLSTRQDQHLVRCALSFLRLASTMPAWGVILDSRYVLADYYWRHYNEKKDDHFYNRFLESFLVLKDERLIIKKPSENQKLHNWVEKYLAWLKDIDPVVYGLTLDHACTEDVPIIGGDSRPQSYLKVAVESFDKCNLMEKHYSEEERERVVSAYVRYAYQSKAKECKEDFVKYCRKALEINPKHECSVQLAQFYFTRMGTQDAVEKSAFEGEEILNKAAQSGNIKAASTLLAIYREVFTTPSGFLFNTNSDKATHYTKLFLRNGGTLKNKDGQKISLGDFLTMQSKKASLQEEENKKIEAFAANVQKGHFQDFFMIFSEDMKQLPIHTLMKACWESMPNNPFIAIDSALNEFKERVKHTDYTNRPNHFLKLMGILAINLEKNTTVNQSPELFVWIAQHYLSCAKGLACSLEAKGKSSTIVISVIQPSLDQASKALDLARKRDDVSDYWSAEIFAKKADVILQDRGLKRESPSEKVQKNVFGICLNLKMAIEHLEKASKDATAVGSDLPGLSKAIDNSLYQLDILLMAFAGTDKGCEKNAVLKGAYKKLENAVASCTLIKYELKGLSDNNTPLFRALKDILA